MSIHHRILDLEPRPAVAASRRIAHGLVALSWMSLMTTLPGLWPAWFGILRLGLPIPPLSWWVGIDDAAFGWIAGANGAVLLGFLVVNPIFHWIPARDPAIRLVALATACWILWVLTMYFPDLLIVCSIG